MKIRIAIAVVVILAALVAAYFATQTNTTAPEGFPSGSDIRNLKIN